MGTDFSARTLANASGRGEGHPPATHPAPADGRWESRKKRLFPRMKRSKHFWSPCLPQIGSLVLEEPWKRNLGWAPGATEAGENSLRGLSTELRGASAQSRALSTESIAHSALISHLTGCLSPAHPAECERGAQRASGPSPSPLWQDRVQRSSAALFLSLFLLSPRISDLAHVFSPFLSLNLLFWEKAEYRLGISKAVGARAQTT